MAYQDDSALEDQIKALMTPEPRQSYASGLANGIRMFAANRLADKKRAIDQSNVANRAQELAMLLKGAQSPDGRVGDTYASTTLSNYVPTDPTVQALAAKLRLEQQQNEKQNPQILQYQYGKQDPGFNDWLMKQEAMKKSGRGQYGLTPVVGQDAKGNFVPFQLSSEGGINPLQMPEGTKFVPDSGRLSYDSEAITNKRDAERLASIKDILAKQGPEAAAAALKTLAEGQAQNTTLQNSIPIKADLAGAETTAKDQAALGVKRQADKPSAELKLAALNDQTDLVDSLVNNAVSNADGWTTGLLGSAAAKVPGTKAFTLAQTLRPLKSNLTLGSIRELKDEGGTLGQISNYEDQLLGDIYGSVEQAQTPQDFIAAMKQIQDQVHKRNARMSSFVKSQYGGQAPTAQSTPAKQGRFQILEVKP